MTFELPSQVYVSSANVDMRKSIDGLSAIVSHSFSLDPFSDAMFVFHNRHCDKVKILYWDRNGFCLLYKRIERLKFRFPKVLNDEVYEITKEELSWLLNGLNVEEIKRYETLKKSVNTSI